MRWFCWLPFVWAFPGCLCHDGTRDGLSPAAASSNATLAPSPATPAARVCTLLQREPARRRAECCGAGAGRHLALECEQTLSAALSRGSLQLDTDAVNRCAAALSEERSGCDWVTPSQELPPAACRNLTRGNVADGGSCRSSLECAGSLHCQGGTPSEPGHCAAPQPDGSACHAPGDALAVYLFALDLERAHPSCSGACSLASQRCEAAPPRATGATARRAPPGEACRTDFDCELGGCVDGRCGMKCAVSFAAPPAEQPVLAFRRHARAERVSASD